MKLRDNDNILKKILLIAAILMASWRSWNLLFRYHISESGYQFDMFRNSMQTWFSPIYGEFSVGRLPFYAIFAVGLCCFLVYKKGRDLLDKPAAIYWIMGIQLLLTLSFGLTDGSERWLDYGTHFGQFANGLPYCDRSIAVLFSRYSEIMAMRDLGFHLNHYPPGNLLLLLIGQLLHFPPFAKLITVILAVATCFQLQRIAKTLAFDTTTTNYGLLLYATNLGVLVFPSIDFAALLPFFGCWMIAAFLKAWFTQKWYFSIELGVATVFFAIFSFNFPLIIGFIGIFSLIYLFCTYKNGENVLFFIKNAVFIGITSAIFAILCFYTLFLLTKFNILTCFTTSIANNSKQADYHAFDSLSRYLLRSTGNVIAYLVGSLGIATTVLLFFIKKSPKTKNEAIWATAAISTLIFTTFCTLFIGETERIWLYFTPLLTLSAAITLTNWQKKYEFPFIAIFLAGNLLYALGWELFFVHFR